MDIAIRNPKLEIEMDVTTEIDEIFQQVCNTLQEEGSVESMSKLFSTQTNDSDRVEIAMKLLKDRNLTISCKNCLTQISKILARSVELRTEGNKTFQRKDDERAFMLYTESIAIAPFPKKSVKTFTSNQETDLIKNEDNLSDALALAFANRSAVLLVMKKYKACLSDITQALKYDYPNKLLYKLFERQGKCFQALGEIQSSVECFENALKWLPSATALTDDKKETIAAELRNLMKQTSERTVCLQSEQCQSIVPVCSYNKNREIICASDCVALKYTVEMGRHIVASGQILPGDVLAVEKPFTSVLLPKYYKTHCYNCLQRSHCLVPCHQCSTVMFCSEECRSLSWNSNHSVDCSLLTTLQKLNIGKMGFLALKIIIIVCTKHNIQNILSSLEAESECNERSKGFNESGFYSSEDYSPIYWLVGNTEKRTVGDLFRRAVTAACILECLDTMTDFFSKISITDMDKAPLQSGMSYPKFLIGGLLLRHLQNLPCNAHEVSELVRTKNKTIEEGAPMWESIEIGAAAYAMLSLVNHSCDPNVVRHSYQGDTAVLRAIRPIAKGEQVLDNYGYHYALQDRVERIDHLEAQYYFTCNCTACKEDWPAYGSLPDTKPRYICDRCRHILPAVADHTRNVVINCINCNETHNIADFIDKITQSSDEFHRNLEQVVSGEGSHWDELAQKLISHLNLLDKKIQRPWKEYNDCQEAIKQCFAMTANCYKE